MLANNQEMRIGDILNLFKNNMLQVNAEYQRGEVWTRPQKQKLIDSVLRGYPLPKIYLHHIKRHVADMQRDDLEIIDGQQRINTFFEFSEGAYELLDPSHPDARLPEFLQSQPCPWAKLTYDQLSEELRTKFLETKVSVEMIESDNPNEIRDLFVRLQAGFPLNAQEKRDANPGGFTEFILKLGGKPQLARYQGHDFFRRVLGMNPGNDRGKTRQLAAQITMLFLHRRETSLDKLMDINAGRIDEFYYQHLDFDPSSTGAKRLQSILDKLTALLGDGKRPKLRAHDAIHLVLLTDTLWDEYTNGWEGALPTAVDKFSYEMAQAVKRKDWADPGEYWTRYAVWTRVNSDRGDRITARHGFYSEQMFDYLSPLTLKDPQRLFGPLEREIVYFRDAKKCRVCDDVVAWGEVDIHHIVEHSQGGRTTLENAALVHRRCHPQGQAAQDFQASQPSNQ